MTDIVEASAAEVFAEWHGHETGPGGTSTVYRALLPATAPGPGEQYRFEVDLDVCTGCKSCVTACHSLNGLDETETWRSVGMLIGGGKSAPPAPSAPSVTVLEAPIWQQHVTTACHHCLEPACLAGCPVDAYEKDPISGIVAHLDDQCIGCRYCMLTCPYEVPTFNARLGIVRKCDMCSDRLADGEAPACVQGCPTSAIAIGLVNTAELGADLAVDPEARLVPTAPRSAHTGPTTVYLTQRRVPTNASAADDHRLVPASNHPPLVAMLVLTQLSVGAFGLSQLDVRLGQRSAGVVDIGAAPSFLAWFMSLVALGASVLHLGRPLMAWRAVLGLGHSWLSREIVAFGVYAALGGATAAAAFGILPNAAESPLAVATTLVGVIGVLCSAQLYAVTSRPLWRIDRTMIRFAVGTVATGAATFALTASLAAWTGAAPLSEARRISHTMSTVVFWSVLIGGVSGAVFIARHRGSDRALGRSVWLMAGPLRSQSTSAVMCAAVGVFIAHVVPEAHLGAARIAGGWAAVLLALVCAAWIERGLYFTAAAPDRMPGGFH